MLIKLFLPGGRTYFNSLELLRTNGLNPMLSSEAFQVISAVSLPIFFMLMRRAGSQAQQVRRTRKMNRSNFIHLILESRAMKLIVSRLHHGYLLNYNNCFL